MNMFRRPAVGPVRPFSGSGLAPRFGGPPRLLLAMTAAACAWLSGPLACATPFVWFTDQPSFLAALDPGAFTATGENLKSGGGDLQASSKTFGGGGSPAFGFTVTATGGLYGTVIDPGIQPLELNIPLTFETLVPSQRVTAFGGLFSLLDETESRQAGNLSLALFSGPAGDQLIASRQLTATSVSPAFLGLITYGGTQPIVRATLTATTTPESLLPTAERVVVGVPEPSTGAVALAAAGLLCGLHFAVRRSAGRVVAVSLVLAIMGLEVPSTAAEPPPAGAVGPSLAKAADLRAKGSFDEALEVLRQATRTVKQSAGDEATELLPVYELAVEILIETDAFDKAAALLDKSLALHATLLAAAGGFEPKLTASHARALLLEGRMHSHAGRLIPAVESAARAARMLDRAAEPAAADVPRAVVQLEAAAGAVGKLLGPTHESVLEANLLVAQALESIGRCDAAAARRATRLAAMREAAGPADPDALVEACHIARLRMDAGKVAAAVADLETALEAAPPETRGYAAAVRTLGRLQMAAEHFTEARQAYLRAADIDTATPGAMPFAPLHDRLLAGMVEFQGGRKQAPIGELDAAVAALPEEMPGSDPSAPAFVEGLRDAAEIALAVGRNQQAKELGARGLALAQACPGLSAAERTAMTVAAARPLVVGDETEEAKAALEQVVREADEQIGHSHPQTQSAVLALAECLAATAPASATPLVERLLSSGAISPTTETEERLVRLIESVAAKQQADGTGRTASAWGDELLRLRREQWGADHPRVATTCLTLAAGRLGSGDSDAAIARCREAIAIQEKALKKDHPEVAAGLLIMAEAHRLNGNFDDAAAALSRSLAIWEAKAGTRREVTLVAVRSLAGIRLAQGRGSDALPLLERLLAAGGDTALAHPARHARLLVQLAGALATTDAKERSRRCLNEALSLPCFEAANGRADSEIRQLVFTLAEAARLLAVLEDQPAATETIRRARGLAIDLKSPRDTLTLIDEIAAGEKPLPPGRL